MSDDLCRENGEITSFDFKTINKIQEGYDKNSLEYQNINELKTSYELLKNTVATQSAKIGNLNKMTVLQNKEDVIKGISSRGTILFFFLLPFMFLISAIYSEAKDRFNNKFGIFIIAMIFISMWTFTCYGLIKKLYKIYTYDAACSSKKNM